MNLRNRTAAVVTGAGALASALALAAPQASAKVTGIDVAQSTSFGSSNSYGTGCSYTITATSTGKNVAVVFMDEVNGVKTTADLNPVGHAVDAQGHASVTWTPTQAGTHTIYAGDYVSGETYLTTQVTVGTGINLGPVCVVVS